MLTSYFWKNSASDERKRLLARPPQSKHFQKQVETIISCVKSRGDEALYALTREFDGIDLTSLQVSPSLVNRAQISASAMDALTTAINTITSYHQSLLPQSCTLTTIEGVTIERVYRPINKVGLYVPGGNNTPLVSSLLMQAIPARVAGCPIKVLCTPPNSAGQLDPHLLVAAKLCSIEAIYQVGGAQAIAAMAYGTESIPKVDKLFGPGNSFVTEAKSQVATDPLGAAIDMPAGPSEVMIATDTQANPTFVAADLLAQAEHGVDSQVILLCENEQFANQVKEAVAQQLVNLSRKTIIEQALKHSRILICEDIEEQCNIINNYAPEHLIINRADAVSCVPNIQSAGTIFVGQWAAETLGDYATGSNHVLPTNGYARNHNGLGTMDFLKTISVQHVSPQGLTHLSHTAQTLAFIEGLDAHANAVKLRMEALE
ncbi:histidinol dehydrogenase [Legionella jamestowniensis]|uniref:Histidinol dehydrogenase n=1 Tax=Legionella jamestowniensis TaxID=455 RepID=A0A0W0UGD6_9GAMM|nr:histidinol dehydrogenase [Legionella jamestowniensis]KTD06890.1 histidinol dehydrogenase [Legionella jamestowniensis]OCH97416.1 histidinol dehydrogenase [Legionella jamestowniensis]SFL85537.1 histidinol dehydrogenase [Legionella jamestowniensis DSM 19215]